MENNPFIDDFPIKTPIYEGFSADVSSLAMARISSLELHSRGSTSAER